MSLHPHSRSDHEQDHHMEVDQQDDTAEGCNERPQNRLFFSLGWKGQKASLGNYNPLFREYLARAQKAQPKLFVAAVPINNFSLCMSLLRGATTTKVENNNMDMVRIELINRWRKKEADRGAEADLSMMQVHMQVSMAMVAAHYSPKVIR
jgi:hypothetical protein